jgi:hypothetical protein
VARKSTPAVRATASKKEVQRVRRKYKTNLNKSRKFLPGEQDHVIDMIVVLKVSGYPNTQIAQVVGISREQVGKLLKEPDVTERLVMLRAALPQAALDLMQAYMVEAVVTVVDVMRTESDSKYVLQAAAEILDRGGMPKSSRQERHSTEEHNTTFTDDGIVERLREAPPEVQEKAAQMIEEFEKLLTDYADVVVGEESDDDE